MSDFTVREDEAVTIARVSGQWLGTHGAGAGFWPGDETGEESGED
jgi:hypothetical protein